MHRIKESAERARRCRHLNFLISETFDLAEKHCEAALGTAHTPFVMVVKDNFAVRGVRMTCASKMLREFVPPYTATSVQRLLKNGGCLLGKSNMDEFAMGSTSSTGCFGPVLHAMYANDANGVGGTAGGAGGVVDDFRIAGGSSGGCAVAVATGVADVAIGSDTGGSVRYPAALNGVYGFKPSYGRLSRHGLVPLNNALDTPSIFARTAEQCRTYFEILRGHDPMDATSLPDDVVADKQPTKRAEAALDDGTLTIGIPEFDHSHFVSDDALRVWHAAIEQLERAVGARTRAVRMPNWEAGIQCYATLTDLDVASNMARYDGIRFGHNDAIDDGTSFTEQITASRTAMLGQNVKRRIFAGNFFGLQQNFERFVGQATRVRRLIQRDFQRAFEQCDVLLTPCSRHSAPLLSEAVRRSRAEQHRMDDFFLIPANLCGVPAISVPFARCAEGRPLGVQLIGPYLADDFLLQVAALLVPLPTDHQNANSHTN